MKKHLFLINHGNLFAMGPLLYVFLLSINAKRNKIRIHLLHLVPFVLFKLAVVIVDLASVPVSVQFGKWISYIMALYCLGYSFGSLFYLIRKSKLFSKIDVRYLYTLIGIFLLGWLFSIVARIVESSDYGIGQIIWQITYIIAGLFIYFISWSMIKNTKILVPRTYVYDKNPDFEQRLKQLFDEDKMYLNPTLTRQDIAKRLNLSNHEISYHLSQHLKTSFTDFVNGYRIEEFKRKLEKNDNPNYTFLGMALDCGFGSKASFQRAFKKKTGKTPSEYKKEVQKII
ncbi:helix-turn-helix domain-containing protein [Flagellimonas nanhaiensis]|nr:helix-turn-helix domain-containing protein [Allomuricauda nanhaiensis]